MEFRILGPFEVLDEGGTPRPVGGIRERALLALLVLSANRVVSAERLADDLWGERPPEGALHALQVHVSRLRKALREAGQDGVLVTRSPGYLFRVEPAAVDAVRFESLLAKGREQAASGDHARAAETLREALALWRGPALVDVADAAFARVEAARLEEARLGALEERIEADLACGRHGELVAELEVQTRAHPLRERLWAQRMLALYRAGRQAEALRAYQDLRGVLGDELGLEPSAALARLEGAILRHEPELEWPPEAPAAAPRPASAVGGGTSPSGVITFLFTDLVGSTELLERLGEDAAEELHRTHFGLLRRAVSDAGGQEMKSLGDGLMVAFSSPLAALRCAIAIQEAIASHNRAHPEKALRVRVGVHSGEPVQQEDDFFGTAVVVANRLCDRAEGGQILASGLVAGLVGSRGGIRFASVGPLLLKGLAVPVPTVAIGWPGLESEEVGAEAARGEAPPPRIPMPALLTEMGRVFVGRDRELEQLEQLWKEAGAGDRRLALLSGEPGVGKTRLAAEFARRLHTAGGTVLAGRCDEDLGVPYQPFVEALRQFVEHTPPARLAARLGHHGGELVRLLPDLAARAPGLPPPLHVDPETERYRLFDAVAAWLAAVSSETPLLLVLDDIQWAAKPTLLLLRHVVRSPDLERVLVLGIYRDTELSHNHPLVEVLADLRRQGGVTRISLLGLDSEGVAAFIEQAAGHVLDEEDLILARAIHHETEGNPFFVREVVRHLTETGAVERREGRWTTRLPVEELGIPEGVREVVGRRLSQLSKEANRVLRVAAVIGPEFELPVLRAAETFEEEHLIAALEEASEARLVREIGGPGSRYRFAHALVRDTLYDALSGARRVALHKRVAEAIEVVHVARLDDQFPALAHHYARAAAPAAETVKAVLYATRAGDRALAQLAHDEAAEYYRQALEFLDAAHVDADGTRRMDLLLALGEAQRRAGQPAHRETLLEAARLARQHGDAARLAQAALANRRGFFPSSVAVVDTERVAVLEAAIEVLGAVDSPTRARLLATLALELLYAGDRKRRLALADEALALARKLDDAAALADVLLNRFYTISEPDTLDERLANTAELLGLAEHLADPVTRAHALWLRYGATMEAGDVIEADRCLDDYERLADELGHAILRYFALFCRGSRAVVAGRIDEAERLAAATLEHGQASGQPDAPVYFTAQQFDVRFEQGRLGEMEERLTEVVHKVPLYKLGRARLAFLRCELDRPEQAKAVLEATATGDFDHIPRDWTWLAVVTLWAGVCAYLGDTQRAAVLYGLLHPYGKRLATSAVRPNPSVSYYLGMLATTLGRLEEAEAHFATAAATHEAIGAPTWLARTRLEWARMLLTRLGPKDAEWARELLGQASATARELGLGNVERRAAKLLQEGKRPQNAGEHLSS
jgi:DNA-binding SARP family transcriptional activator